MSFIFIDSVFRQPIALHTAPYHRADGFGVRFCVASGSPECVDHAPPIRQQPDFL